jgi:hypothetical protein
VNKKVSKPSRAPSPPAKRRGRPVATSESELISEAKAFIAGKAALLARLRTQRDNVNRAIATLELE